MPVIFWIMLGLRAAVGHCHEGMHLRWSEHMLLILPQTDSYGSFQCENLLVFSIYTH